MIEIQQSDTFRKWRMKLTDDRLLAAVAVRLQRLSFGNAGDVRPVGRGISELRINYGPGYRIYFQQRGNEVILLLCGGDKSSQAKDINNAKLIAEEWEKRNG